MSYTKVASHHSLIIMSDTTHNIFGPPCTVGLRLSLSVLLCKSGLDCVLAAAGLKDIIRER